MAQTPRLGGVFLFSYQGRSALHSAALSNSQRILEKIIDYLTKKPVMPTALRVFDIEAL